MAKIALVLRDGDLNIEYLLDRHWKLFLLIPTGPLIVAALLPDFSCLCFSALTSWTLSHVFSNPSAQCFSVFSHYLKIMPAFRKRVISHLCLYCSFIYVIWKSWPATHLQCPQEVKQILFCFYQHQWIQKLTTWGQMALFPVVHLLLCLALLAWVLLSVSPPASAVLSTSPWHQLENDCQHL